MLSQFLESAHRFQQNGQDTTNVLCTMQALSLFFFKRNMHQATALETGVYIKSSLMAWDLVFVVFLKKLTRVHINP